jgi:hypothetical protein
MPEAFKRLRLLGRRPPEPDPAPVDEPAVDIDAMPLAGAMSESSPALRPAAIFRQLLFDPAESSPVWARPRPAPVPDPAIAPSASTAELKPTKRTRRPKADASAGANRTRTKRTAKSDPNLIDG